MQDVSISYRIRDEGGGRGARKRADNACMELLLNQTVTILSKVARIYRYEQRDSAEHLTFVAEQLGRVAEVLGHEASEQP